ncbi:PhzF family phenazine biosynthesis protein [Candidatus Methylomicrobium oryzae]|jgi:trans-2,3-dihydro-3-hydroxyanthranilate isomerase|uniref:PhzF family phenazine biosynthesis protein n=1 Tax=Candidatus Methylomicrobium oryzae TaxID=2802053 RepID=UPI0019241F9D|nr:PhzF family phenazine biosynthesis protein [Methylomicrobium sp. RS1]MBL1262266.1 PhzF family phenazine biosynthesis protein [Methylomicrobium sp. RS1]
MNYQYYIADVFTREVFNGAQIAVFPHADGLDDRTMQKIANELNLWETVFVFHPGGDLRRLRMFSPKAEVDFAGHPIIAAAYVLGLCGDITLDAPVTPVVFEQNAGPVEVNITAENGKPAFVQFTNKVSSIVDRFAPNDEELASVLSIPQADLDRIKYSARLVACGMPYLIVPVWKYETVRKARFDYAAWSRSAAPQTAAQEILLFAPKTPYSDSDFNLRLLGPHIGHDDDPPVGAAVPAFASYLCSFEHTRKGTHTFAVDRGDADSRRSLLNIEMDHKGKAQLTLRVGGSAAIFAQGTVFLPD